MIRFLYLAVCSVLGIVLALLVGAILLIFTTFTGLKIAAVVGIGILIYVLFFIAGIGMAIKDPFKLDE